MRIDLQNIMPLPMLDLDCSDSSVWGEDEVVFESGMHYMVQAVSGKGKTSLLSFLYGTRSDYEGTILVDGASTKEWRIKEWATFRQTKVSYLFQGLNLFDHLTGWENIMLNNQLTNHRTRAEIRSMSQRVAVDTLLDRPVSTLSFGQKQRVAMIRALCQPFRFLLLDEPFSHLDQENGTEAFKLIEEVCFSQDAGMLLTVLDVPSFLSINRIVKI